MKNLISWTFIIGLFVLAWWSPMHAIAVGVILAGLGTCYIGHAAKDMARPLYVLALKASREMRMMEAQEKLDKAMKKYGFPGSKKGES